MKYSDGIKKNISYGEVSNKCKLLLLRFQINISKWTKSFVWLEVQFLGLLPG